MDTPVQLTLDQIRKLRTKQEELLARLDRSLAISDHFPDAFEHGRVRTYVQGNPRTVLLFTIVRGDGSKRERDLAELPLVLWTEDVRANIRHAGSGAASRYRQALEGAKQ